MQSFLLTGLWRLKVHKSWAVCKIRMGSRSEKIAIGTGKRAIRANKMTNNALVEAFLGVKKVKILIEFA